MANSILIAGRQGTRKTIIGQLIDKRFIGYDRLVMDVKRHFDDKMRQLVDGRRIHQFLVNDPDRPRPEGSRIVVDDVLTADPYFVRIFEYLCELYDVVVIITQEKPEDHIVELFNHTIWLSDSYK